MCEYNPILSKCEIRELARIHSEEYFERKRKEEKKKSNIFYLIYQWLIKDL